MVVQSEQSISLFSLHYFSRSEKCFFRLLNLILASRMGTMMKSDGRQNTVSIISHNIQNTFYGVFYPKSEVPLVLLFEWHPKFLDNKFYLLSICQMLRGDTNQNMGIVYR